MITINGSTMVGAEEILTFSVYLNRLFQLSNSHPKQLTLNSFTAHTNLSSSTNYENQYVFVLEIYQLKTLPKSPLTLGP